jgi:hypothetical protein
MRFLGYYVISILVFRVKCFLGYYVNDLASSRESAARNTTAPRLPRIQPARVGRWGVQGERTKKAAVTRALEEFIARRKQKHLLELMGKLEWDSEYAYKAERSR